MNQEEIFDSLTRNAFDFLQRGIEEFDKAPKYSVIHFCAAVEMLLKARLMKEHWALIVSKPERANLEKFIAGDFISVTLEDAHSRMSDVAGEDIGDAAYTTFRALANHRNKMVHFFHNGLERDEETKAQIVAEHCRSWFHLHRLLVRWGSHFCEFSDEIASANAAMLRHRKYLSAKFDALRPELDTARTTGNPPKLCPACDYMALDCQTSDRYLDRICRVCGYEVPSQKAIQQGYEYFNASCANCNGAGTVFQAGFGFRCSDCDEVFDKSVICEYCNAHWVGVGEDFGDAATGCDHCGGKLASIRDD